MKSHYTLHFTFTAASMLAERGWRSDTGVGVGVVHRVAVADSDAHPLLEGRAGRESIGKRGKDRVRRDFWEPSEGRGSHPSLKRERRVEVRLHQGQETHGRDNKELRYRN